MMHAKPIFILVFGAFFLTGPASAQITLTNEQYQSPLGDTLVSVNVNALTMQPAYYAPPAEGPDQQWDYRWLEYTDFEVDPEPIFSDPQLPAVNNVDQNVAIGDFTPDSPIPLTIFERYDDNGKFLVGGEVSAPFTAPLVCGTCTDGDSVQYSTATGDNLLEEEEPLLQLPLQYQDSWSADYTRTLTMQLFLPTFGLNDVSAQQTDSVSVTSEVVGWGSLTIPNLTYSGTQDLEVLLLKQTFTQRTFYTVDGNPAPQALLDTLGVEQGQTLVLTFYQFYAPGLDQPALQFTFDQAGQVFNYSVAASIQEVNPEEEGTFVQKTTMHDGVERSYWMYTPPGYDGSEDLPLVMALHGYSSVAKQMTWQSQYNYVADTAGFLVVYPQGLLVDGVPGGPLPPVAPGWNIPDGPLASGTDDVGFLGSLVGELQNDYAVDANRVYVSGISNGGFMSSVMAAARPDIFAAMGVSAGVIPAPRQALVPTMIIHGTADPLVPFAGDTVLGVPSVPETFGLYGLFNSCSTDPIVTNLPDLDPDDGTTVTRIAFPDCAGDADVVMYQVNGGSHVWEGVGEAVPPAFVPVIGNTVSQDIHAGVELWNFMKQYTTPHARLLSHSVQVDTVERTYQVYVPKDYDGSEPWPVVYNLHEANAPVLLYMASINTNVVADTAGFLVVYPQALDFYIGALDTVGAIWQDGTLAGNLEADDLSFFDQMLDQVAMDFNVDHSRVYTMGSGSGGAASAFLTCQMPDRFAAMANHHGFIDCAPEVPKPGLFMFGTADPFIPESGLPGILPPFTDGVLDWATASSCSTMPDSTLLPDLVTSDSSTVTVYNYPDCSGGSEVLYYRIEGGGRNFPGGSNIPDSGPVNRDINADVEIWNFFNRHSLPEPQLLTKTIMVDTTEREYLLYVPAAYDGSEDWPMVLNLHGFLGFPEEQIFGSQMNPVADTAHFLVAYPKGLLIDGNAFEDGGEPDFGTGWNITGTLSENDDYAFMEAMIDQITMEYAVDESKVFASGFSLGGLMSQNLACSMSDRFAAVAAVGFDLQGPDILACEPGRAVPMLYMHGTNDFIVPYMETPGFFGAEGTVDFWVDNNGCSMDSMVTMFPDTDTADGSTVTRTTYQNCEGDSEVWFYRIDGGGHAWPGGELVPPAFAAFLGNLNRDINGSSEIWNFFNRHSLPEPQLLTKTIMVDTTEREYLLYVPAAYDGSEDWPMVLNLHGFLGFPEEQIFGSQMNPVADTAHFLVAYPKGLLIDGNAFEDGGEPDFGTGWNITGTLSENDDYAFMEAMIDQITMEYAVDESKVFASGFSLGGLMSQNLACSMSDRFAAVAAVGFDLQGPDILACEPGRAVPMLYMHGTNDFIVPYMETPGFFGAEGTVDFWVDNNGCSMDSMVTMFPDTDTADGSTVTRTAYQNCEGDSEVWFYRIDGGGHAWPGGELVPPAFAAFLGNLNRDINGSSEIWNFFNRQRLVTSTQVVPFRAFDVRVFPNPVSDQLNLEFTLSKEAPVSLQLVSPLGQTVANLFEGRLPAGEQQITLQTGQYRIPRGLYFYQLRIGNQMTSGQIVWQ